MDDETKAELFRSLGSIEAKLETLAELKPIVERHERVYQTGKILAVPGLAVIHLGLKHLFSRW